MASFLREPHAAKLLDMNRSLLLSFLVVAVVLLAVGGWTVRGVRWTFATPGRLRLAPAV